MGQCSAPKALPSYHRELVLELHETVSGPTIVFTDNKAVVDMSLDPVSFKRTQHILRSANFLRDLVAKKVVKLQHIPGKDNAADIFTKPQGRAQFVECLRIADTWAQLAAGFRNGYLGAKTDGVGSSTD